MTFPSLNQAITAVLAARGVLLNLPQDALTEKELQEQLAGVGVAQKRMALLYQALPDDDEQLGCVLLRSDGSFLAVEGAGEHGNVVGDDGRVTHTLTVDDLAGTEEVLVLLQRASREAGQVLPHIRKHQSKLVQVFLCGILVNMFALTLPLFSSFVYDKVLANGITATLWALVIGLVLIAVVDFSLRAIRIIVAERIARSSDAGIDGTILRSLLKTKPNALPDMGVVLERYKQLVYYRDFVSSTYMLALADLPFLVLFALTIMVVSGPLVLVGLGFGVLLMVSNTFLIRPAFGYEKKSRRASEKRLGLLADILNARDAMLGKYAENAMSGKWHAASNTASYSSSMARVWFGISQSVSNELSFLSYAVVLVGGAYMVEANTLTSGGLLASTMLTARLIGSFSSITTLFVRYHELRNALSELNKILPTTQDQATQSHHGIAQASIRLDAITCNIGHGGHSVFKDVSLHITHGEMIGLAGAPGSGKTTLMRLITGLMQPDEGQVLIDDIPVACLSSDDISRVMGYKPQDISLMDGSIEDNIRAGRPQLSSEMRKRVLDLTGLSRDFHENGLNWTTQVGQRGSHLSGGQRQLVALARAIAFEPKLLLLDEPTNGLDAQLEEHLAKQLATMKGKSTLIISTHSRHLLSLCDRIIVVGRSRVLADGPRDKVLLKPAA